MAVGQKWTDVGQAFAVDQLDDNTATASPTYWGAWGAGGNTPAVGDTTLQTENAEARTQILAAAQTQPAIERAEVLYFRNSTTVDTAAGIDVRLLDDVNAAVLDETQTVRFTHTQDNQERTFDPASALVTLNEAANVFRGEGWALRLTEDMTPTDDTNCNAYLPASTVAVQLNVKCNMNGGTNLGGVTTGLFRVALFHYDPSANTGVLIAAATQSVSWDTSVIGAENNIYKTPTVNVAISATEFPQGEILLVQVGLQATTLPDATLGTTNFDFTFGIDTVTAKITFAAGKGVHQACTFSLSATGKGAATRGILDATVARTATGKGTTTASKATVAAKTFNLVGKGVTSMTRAVVAAKTFDLTGRGIASRVLALALERTTTGRGMVVWARVVVAAKSVTVDGRGTVTHNKADALTRSVTGKGLITEVHPVQAFRTFALVGKGELAGRIEIPIDEVPGADAVIVRRPVFVFDE